MIIFSSQESVWPWDSFRTLSKLRARSASAPIPLSQMEAGCTEIDQSSKSQMAGSSSYISTDSQGRYVNCHEVSHEVSHDVNVNSGPEK